MPKALEKITDIINSSGHDLHFDVVRILRERGWSVLVSPYYSDAQTGRSREIDIIATREDEFCNNRILLTTRLFIECKYMLEQTVFWFDDIDKEARIGLTSRVTPFDERELRSNGAQHHYLRPLQAAKLFSSSNKSTENEPFFGAINQVLHGMLYSPKPQRSSTHYEHRSSTYYPVIVCKNFNNCLARDSEVDAGFQSIDSAFLFEANYAYLDPSGSRKSKYVLIDVVDFEKLTNFLDEIDIDIEAFKGKIAFEQRSSK